MHDPSGAAWRIFQRAPSVVTPKLDKAFLLTLYRDVGMEPVEAETAAEATWRRLLRRARPDQLSPVRRGDLLSSLVRDPMVSFNRIVGLGDDRLPFLDESTGTLSLVAFASLLDEVGMVPDVALAYAKVVVEMFEPSQFFEPVWSALDQEGAVDLEVLRRLDWSPLRAGLRELDEGLTKTEIDLRAREKDEP